MADMKVGMLLDNVSGKATVPDSSIKKLQAMGATAVGTLWTPGTHHRRELYERCERALSKPQYILRVGGPKQTAVEWTADARAAVAEVPGPVLVQGRIVLTFGNEPNIEWKDTPESYGSTYVQVAHMSVPVLFACPSLGKPGWYQVAHMSVPVLFACPSLGKPGWYDWLMRAGVAAGSVQHAIVNLYATNVGQIAVFAGLFEHLYIGEVNVLYQPRGDWMLRAFDRLNTAGVKAALIFIAGGNGIGWPAGYIIGEQEAPSFRWAPMEAIVVAQYPGAIWRPSPNCGYPAGTRGRAGHLPVAIVDHISGPGDWQAIDNWFMQSGSGASAHYVVARDGVIRQYVQEEDAAWGCGIDWSKGYAAYKSDTALDWIADLWRTQTNPNLVVVNIEHEGVPGEPLTEAQYQASSGLQRALVAKYALPLNRIVGHCRIDAVNRVNDPGPAFPWARLLKDLNGEGDMDAETKAKILEALNMQWGMANSIDEMVKAIRADCDRMAESAATIRTRVIAIKRAAGLDL